jgi:hypothetical protein
MSKFILQLSLPVKQKASVFQPLLITAHVSQHSVHKNSQKTSWQSEQQWGTIMAHPGLTTTCIWHRDSQTAIICYPLLHVTTQSIAGMHNVCDHNQTALMAPSSISLCNHPDQYIP